VTLIIAVVAPVEILANDLDGDDLDDLVDLIVTANSQQHCPAVRCEHPSNSV